MGLGQRHCGRVVTGPVPPLLPPATPTQGQPLARVTAPARALRLRLGLRLGLGLGMGVERRLGDCELGAAAPGGQCEDEQS